MEMTAEDGGAHLLTTWMNLAKTNSDAAASFGARVVILSQFVEATLPELSPAQRREITRRFRQRVEDVLAYGDDIVMPPGYHAALLGQANVLLKALKTDEGIGR